jgi:hypothetical protein
MRLRLEVDYEKAKVAAMGKRKKIKCFEIRQSQKRAAKDRPEDETTGRPERKAGRGGEE